MMGKTTIAWTDYSWPIINGCRRVSAGCENCYAERLTATRLSKTPKYAELAVFGKNGPRWTGKTRLWAPHLDLPLKIRKPSRIFVADMGDLFYEGVADETIDHVFAVMMLAPHHIYQVLTKRPERMREYLSAESTPYRVTRLADRLAVEREVAAMGPEQIAPVAEYPGYFVSDRGRVLSGNGSAVCVHCSAPNEGRASKLYCGKTCKQNANYHRRMGRPPRFESVLSPMSPDMGEQGHQRVMLYRDGEPRRELVHRLVLSAFARSPQDGEQGCHRDGLPANNALPNLRWGTQSDNWADRKRHGHGRSHAKLRPEDVNEIHLERRRGHRTEDIAEAHGISDSQVRNILDGKCWVQDAVEWPPPSLWAGVSVEDQATADERIPLLLESPAAIRFVSMEPALGPVTFPPAVLGCLGHIAETFGNPLIHWIIVGGESGPRARPFNIEWARSTVQQCHEAGVACFVKQLGTLPFERRRCDAPACNCGGEHDHRVILADRKGEDPTEWPEDLRVREFPSSVVP
jgi:protein gp37